MSSLKGRGIAVGDVEIVQYQHVHFSAQKQEMASSGAPLSVAYD
jgi:hypothetical protein